MTREETKKTIFGEDHSSENAWVFEGKEYATEEGIDIDLDTVSQVCKAEPGAYYNGDIKETKFTPVGFRPGNFDTLPEKNIQDTHNTKNTQRSRVEFESHPLYTYKHATSNALHVCSSFEDKIFAGLSKSTCLFEHDLYLRIVSRMKDTFFSYLRMLRF